MRIDAEKTKAYRHVAALMEAKFAPNERTAAIAGVMAYCRKLGHAVHAVDIPYELKGADALGGAF